MEAKISLKKVNCANCGAELIFNPGTQTTNCNFCGSSFAIDNATDEDVEIPDGIVPFETTKEEYHAAVKKWLSKGDYTPDDVLNSSVFDKINGIYFPMYRYIGDYQATWSASANKNAAEMPKSVTDWTEVNGEVMGGFDVLGYAGEDKGVKPEVISFAHYVAFDDDDVVAFDAKYTLGFNLLNFSSQTEKQNWKIVGKKQADEVVQFEISKRLPANQFKELSFNATYNTNTGEKVFIPCWVAYYTYKGKQYYACMDGTSSMRVDGIRPEDDRRKKKIKRKFYKVYAVGILTLLIWILSFSGGAHYTKGESGFLIFFPLFFVFMTYMIARAQKIKIIQKSNAKRQEGL